MARFSAEALDVILAVVLFSAGLGYAMSGFPANIIVACVIWGVGWVFLSHLFFVYDGMDSCPLTVKIVIWAAVTFLIVIFAWNPVRVQYAKEHKPTAPPLAPENQRPEPTARLLPASPRSYLVFDGPARFTERRDNAGKLLPDQNFRIGDALCFNYYYKATGPNPVEMIGSFRWLHVAPDFEHDTQKKTITEFKKRTLQIWKTKKLKKLEGATMMPGEEQFGTAFAVTQDGRAWLVSQYDLDALKEGREIPFVLVEIPYIDNKQLHHLRSCLYLQPPASFPGTWHLCNGFEKSD